MVSQHTGPVMTLPDFVVHVPTRSEVTCEVAILARTKAAESHNRDGDIT